MSTFTTTLPPDDAFNAEPRYIVIDTATNTVFSHVSAQRIKMPIHGFAHRPSCSWAKLSPEMIQGLLQPAPVATDNGERERLRSSMRTAMKRMPQGYRAARPAAAAWTDRPRPPAVPPTAQS